MMRTLGVGHSVCARQQVRVGGGTAKSQKLVCRRPHLSPSSVATCSSSLASMRQGPHLDVRRSTEKQDGSGWGTAPVR